MGREGVWGSGEEEGEKEVESEVNGMCDEETRRRAQEWCCYVCSNNKSERVRKEK